MSQPRFWAHLTSSDFAALDAARAVAILPLGATEQHGPHLPLDVDRAIVDGIVEAALPRIPAGVPALVLPTQAIGYSPEHTAFAGTLSLPYEAVLASWIAAGEAVARAGLKKLLLFNAHGGNVSLMDVAARELRSRGLIVYHASWWNLPLGDAVTGLFPPDEHRFGVHAGAIETSLMLALHPQRVAMDKARQFASSSQERARRFPILGNGRSAKLGWHMQDYNAEGAAGDAASATAEKGRALLDSAAAQLALLVEEIAALPLATVAQPSRA
jgi:creatinine amidohydrolase